MTQHVGPYRLLGSLAKGGAGDVFRAQAPTGQIVALKVLRGPFTERRQRRAEVEIRALKLLEHPAILPMLDCGWHGNGLAYMAFPLAEGGSLQERLKREGQLRTGAALRIVRELAEGLVHAHAQGVLHRDLKPDNVLLGVNGAAQLIDFGLAQELEASYSRLTTSGSFLGTPGYWAPEQAQGQLEQIGPWTDVYGLGATLYACLSSRPPHVAETVGALLALVVQEAPPEPLARLRPGLDPRVAELCMRCLASQPKDRPTLPGLLDELEALKGARGRTAPQGPPRAVVWVAAAAACVALALCAVVVSRIGAEPEQPLARVGLRDDAEREDREGVSSDVTAPKQGIDAAAFDPQGVSRGDMAIALCELSGSTLTAGCLDLSQAFADAAVVVAPEWGFSFFRRGNVFFGQGRIDLAAKDFERALELGLDQPQEGLMNLGSCLRRQGNFDAARLCYEEGLKFAPRWGELLGTLGGLDMDEGKFEAALERYSRAIEAEPERVLNLCNRGTALLKLGRSAEAIPDLERAVALAPGLAIGWENLGLAREGSGDFVGALRAFARSLEVGPTASRHLRRAHVFLVTRQLDVCLTEIDKALALDPRSVLAWLNRGDVFMQLDRVDEAEQAFARAIELGPKDARGYAAQGRALARQGKELEAIAAYDRALQLDPRDTTVLQNRGNAHARLGNHAEAIESYTRLLELAPDSWRALLSRGHVHKLRGAPDLARADLQRVVDGAPGPLVAQARDLLRDLP